VTGCTDIVTGALLSLKGAERSRAQRLMTYMPCHVLLPDADERSGEPAGRAPGHCDRVDVVVLVVRDVQDGVGEVLGVDNVLCNWHVNVQIPVNL